MQKNTVFKAGSALKLGCIADDFTGATDLASNLVSAGMRVIQTIGIPDAPLRSDCDAVVVALKSRTLPVQEAVRQSLEALQWLRDQGAQQIYFKYCSTFDSVYDGPVRGNIGPVTDALMDALGTKLTIATPAFPDNHRTVYKGHLFVGDVLLSDSGMRNHPLTPMRDADLVKVLQAQTQRKVGLVDYRVVMRGAEAIGQRLQELGAKGVEMVVVDALTNEDLKTLGKAVSELKLVTAGSGLAIGLPANFGITPGIDAARLPAKQGHCAVVSGSCSTATMGQVQHFLDQGLPAFSIDPARIAAGDDLVAEALAWAKSKLGTEPVLIYSTANVDAVKATQSLLGVQEAGDMVERTISQIARGLVELGVAQLLVAGGETSGACVQALGITRMQIGTQVAPGVPWCHAITQPAGRPIHILLKSGNFGAQNIFTDAFSALPQ